MKNIFSIVAAALALLLVGCAELRNGDQSSDPALKPTFFLGELRYTEITPYDRAWVGVQQAMKDLNYMVKSKEHDLLQAKIVAIGGGKDIKIEIEENSPTTTEIRIRAGKIGDKALAEQILAAIRKRI